MPDEFFDEVVEAEKEFCDISMSLIHKRGLEGINSIKVGDCIILVGLNKIRCDMWHISMCDI